MRLNVVERAGDGPTLVLLPGLSASARFFDVLATALAPLRVLALDLRGRGGSPKPDRGYSMAEHAADVLETLPDGPLLLGGHSFGGLLTMYLAAHHPERVERALVLDVPAEVDPRVLPQIRPSLARLDHEFASPDEYVAFMRALPYFDETTWDEGIEAWCRAEVEAAPGGGWRAHCRAGHIEQCVEATFVEDWEAIAARIECPTLLLRTVEPYGPPGSPPIMSAEGAQRTAARLRRGELVEVPGNHITFAFGERAAAAAAVIRDFACDSVAA